MQLSKEVWKLNFRQYGEMTKQDSSAEAQKGRKSEERRYRRNGREVAKHSVFPMLSGSGGSEGRIAKAAGAETSGQMRHEKFHAIVARSTL